ncbi:hypothetical protein ILYODFUR_014456 [Ilyodon furcidens]|uniref:Uncharacterized protein n=1 Tax=Ilyodon furcidens TaxID=33524 RepID=A0ABV0UGH2_9TELE
MGNTCAEAPACHTLKWRKQKSIAQHTQDLHRPTVDSGRSKTIHVFKRYCCLFTIWKFFFLSSIEPYYFVTSLIVWLMDWPCADSDQITLHFVYDGFMKNSGATTKCRNYICTP